MWASRGFLDPAACHTRSTAPSFRDHLEMAWSCPLGQVEPLGLDVGFGSGALEGSHSDYWDSSSLRLLQGLNTPGRGETGEVAGAKKTQPLGCPYPLGQWPWWVCNSFSRAKQVAFTLKVANFEEPIHPILKCTVFFMEAAPYFRTTQSAGRWGKDEVKSGFCEVRIWGDSEETY